MSEENNYQLNDPAASYSAEKRITFFSSMQEMDEYKITEMAKLTHEQLLANLNTFRKSTFREYLTADGNWPKMERIITMKQSSTKTPPQFPFSKSPQQKGRF